MNKPLIRSFLEFAIDKPILNHLLLAFIMLLSIFAYINIPKEIFPPMTMDKVFINGGYIGASSDILDKMVVKTIEDNLQSINELETIKSIIKNGSFSIIADIKTGSNNMSVLGDVKDVISSIKKDLPADMIEPTAKIRVHSIPLVLIALAGNKSKEELLAHADELKRELSKFKELSEIKIRGDANKELSIRLNEKRIQAYGLKPSLIISSISNISSIFPIGTIKEKGSHLYISTFNGEKNIEDIEDTIIKVGDIRLKIGDIADVSFELSHSSELSHFNGKKNISIDILKSEDGNAIQLVKDIRVVLKKYSKKYSNIDYEIYTDTSIWIKNRLNTVFSNMVFGLMLVFIAMLIFINKGIAIVVAVGIPMSFMIGLIVSELMGHSLNMLSLLGALVALGMLVDEAIVVAENIYRHLENGVERREAVIVGAMEMFPSVLTATLTTIFAFLPMLLLSGDMGMFLKIIPIMIVVLLLSSLFEAFYFLPLHAHDFLKVTHTKSFDKRFWERFKILHSKILHFVFKSKLISLIVMVFTILLFTFILIKNSKFQLFPDLDNIQVYVSGSVNINNDLENTEIYVQKVEQILLKKIDANEISSITSITGFKLDNKKYAIKGDNLFHIFIDLKEKAPDNIFNKYISPYLSIGYDASLLTRQRSAKEISKEIEILLTPMIALEKDGKKIFENFSVRIPDTGIVAHDVEISISAENDGDSKEAIQALKEALSKINGVKNIEDDINVGEKELKLRVNRYGQELGFNEQIISRELRAYYLDAEYSKMFDKSGILRLKIKSGINKHMDSIQTVELNIPGTSKFIELRDICDFTIAPSIVAVKKENGIKIQSIFASLDKKTITSSELMKKIDINIKKLKEKGLTVNIKGEERENNKNKIEIVQIAVISIFLIFVTLVWLFDSIKKPLIVISIIPLVIVGVYFGHLVMGLNITMPSMIGIAGLIGIVVNDGLIMVIFIKNAKSTKELIELATRRLRPIVLTSLTTVLGLSTLVFFASGQAVILQPMAISLGFGVAWATILNLIYIPLLFSILYSKNLKKISSL